MVAGPSGVGKGTVVKTLLEADPRLALSISATTRAPRPQETRTDYLFVDDAEFSRMVEADELLEWAEVFDHRYGTPRAPVVALRDRGSDVVLEIDVQGARQISERASDAVLILLKPPTMDDLESRLRGRGTETDSRIRRRLAEARTELEQASWFHHVVINDDVQRASSQVAAIIEASRAETSAGGDDSTEDPSE